MNDDTKAGHDATEDTAQHPPVNVSPDEKLAESDIAAPRVPGAESAESEITSETNLNSE